MDSEFFRTLAQAVAVELIGILGIFFLIGYILFRIQRATNAHYTHTIGWKGILLTAWLGTPVHELGHVFFAKLFRHTVTEISLFDPNEATGGLGHVEHSYDPKSMYQRIGNFFIGAAPLLFGALVLLIMLYFLVPNGPEVFAPLTAEQSSPFATLAAMAQSLHLLFAWDNIRAWEFWVFLYMSFCISAHMAPSGQDQKGMWRGFVSLVVLLVILNVIPVLMRLDIAQVVAQIYGSLTLLIAVFFYALIVSILHYILSYICLVIPRKLFS